MNHLETAWTAGKSVCGRWYKRKIDVLSGEGELCGTIVKMSYHSSDGWRRGGYIVRIKMPEGITPLEPTSTYGSYGLRVMSNGGLHRWGQILTKDRLFSIDRTEDWRHIPGGRVRFRHGTHETLKSALAAAKRHALQPTLTSELHPDSLSFLRTYENSVEGGVVVPSDHWFGSSSTYVADLEV